MKSLLCFALLSGSALAQIQLFSFDGTTETPVGAVFNAGSAAVGDTLEARFHVRNTGSAAVTVDRIALAGAGFTITSAPSLPYVLAPANFLEFRVDFAPQTAGSYSASVAVNGLSVILVATGAPAPTIVVRQNGSSAPLATGATIGFGSIQRSLPAPATIGLTLTNTGAAAATVGTISVAGGPAFSGPIGLSAPVTILPGASVAFQVGFQPQTSATFQGTLTIDQRSFKLTGSAFDPPIPTAAILFDNGANASGQQRTVSIQFSSASPAAGSGTLTLAFHPSVANVTDDAAIVFTATGSRYATVSVAVGDSVGKVSGQSAITFQTGTTAGDLTFTLTLGPQTVQSSITIPPAVVALEGVSGGRRIGDLDISVRGFDNSYSASILAFTFYDTAGRPIGPSSITTDATGDFRRYFSATRAGGAFLLRATFPVAGDSSVVAAADVTISNTAGASQTRRVTFP